MKTETSFTKGPWEVNWLANPTAPRYACIYVMPGDHKTVDHVAMIDSANTTFSDWKANTHLIAAAPDLYEALANILSLAEGNNTPDPAEMKQIATWASAALSKANP